MPEPARSNYAFAVLDGKVYIFGGVAPAGGSFRNLAESWSYDFETNEWSSVPSVPIATRAWSAVVSNSSILLLGGYTDKFATTILRFSPKTRDFTHFGELPHGLADAKFIPIDGSIYVSGGESGVKIRSGETWRGRQ